MLPENESVTNITFQYKKYGVNGHFAMFCLYYNFDKSTKTIPLNPTKPDGLGITRRPDVGQIWTTGPEAA